MAEVRNAVPVFSAPTSVFGKYYPVYSALQQAIGPVAEEVCNVY